MSEALECGKLQTPWKIRLSSKADCWGLKKKIRVEYIILKELINSEGKHDATVCTKIFFVETQYPVSDFSLFLSAPRNILPSQLELKNHLLDSIYK